jgi:hypothetical protein
LAERRIVSQIEIAPLIVKNPGSIERLPKITTK